MSRRRKYSTKKRRTKRIAWWSTPKRKLTKREKTARAHARKRSYARRSAANKRARKNWINKAVRHLGISQTQAVRFWEGKDNLNESQALTLLRLRK